MSCDRSWINQRFRVGDVGFSRIFLNGVDEFMNFAKLNCDEDDEEIRCPCCSCRNGFLKSFDDVRFDILTNGFCPHYTFWDLHGEGEREPYTSGLRNIIHDHDDVFDPYEMLRDAGGYNAWNNEEDGDEIDDSEPNRESSKFFDLKNDAGVPLYPGNTTHTKLSFVSKLLHFKSTHRCSERGFNELLGLIGDVFPEGTQTTLELQ